MERDCWAYDACAGEVWTEGGFTLALFQERGRGSEVLLEQVELNFSFRNKFIIILPCGLVDQACQTEGPPRPIWVTFVLSWGPHTTTNWSDLIKIIAEYFYYLNLETYNVHSWMQSNVV